MPLSNIFARMDRRVELMDQMMGTLRVRQAMSELPNAPSVLRRAAQRCLNCKEPETCRAWLDAHRESDEGPPYCPNHELFARVRRRADAADRPAFA